MAMSKLGYEALSLSVKDRQEEETWGSGVGRRGCLSEPLLSTRWSALPLPGSRRARGGHRPGVSPALRSGSPGAPGGGGTCLIL